MVQSIFLCLTGLSLSVSISVMESFTGLLIITLVIYLYRFRIDIVADCPYFLPLFLYWITTLIPFFLGSDKAVVSGNYFTIWVMLIIFTSYYLITAGNIRWVILCLIIGSVALGVSAVYDVLIIGEARGNGFFSIYMTTGNSLALGATLTLGLIIDRKEKLPLRIIYIAALMVIITGIFFTGTRGALLAFVAAGSMMFIVKYKFYGVLLSLVFFGGILGCAMLVGIGERFEELLFGFSDPLTSHGWRILLWKESFNLFKDYPIFGIGSGAYRDMMLAVMPSSPLPLGHAHSGYIQQLVLYGVVGFTAFIYFYGRLFYDLLKRMFDDRYAFIGVFVMLTYFMEAVTENNFTDSEVVLYVLFLTGATLSKKRENSPR